MPRKSSSVKLSRTSLRGRLGVNGTLDAGVLELPTRAVSEYTLAELGSALSDADSGRLRRAADMTRAAINYSGTISGILDTITGGTLSLPLSFVGGDERVRRALEGENGHGEFAKLYPRAEAKRVMAWGVTLGVGLGQFVDRKRRGVVEPPAATAPILAEPLADGSFRVPPQAMRPTRALGEHDTPQLVAWDPRWLRHQWHDDTWHLQTARGEIKIDPGDGEWCLFTPYGQRKPWEYGKWGYLVLDFIFMRDGMFDRSRHSQMLAPVRVGVVPEGTTEAQRKKYARDIESMRRHAWFVLPPGLEYKIVESTGNVRQVYREMIEDSVADVMIGLTGNRVLVDGSSGFNKGDFQQRVSASMRGFYAQTWCDHEHDHGIRPWTQCNYPTAEAPRSVRETDPPEDKDAKIKRIGELGDSLIKLDSGLSRLGMELHDDEGIARLVDEVSGLKIRRKPAGAVTVSKIDLAPTDIAKVVKVNEARASQQLPALADERGEKMISELDAAAPTAPAALPGAPAVPALPQVSEVPNA